MEKKTIFIGIDPDTKKSGVAVYTEYPLINDIFQLSNLSFFELFVFLLNWLTYANKAEQKILVIIDAGWLNKSNFHVTGTNKKINGKIGERVGANHETGKKIVEMCEFLNIDHKLHKPTKSKVNADFFAKITNYKGRTNQDQRDAGMLVYGMK